MADTFLPSSSASLVAVRGEERRSLAADEALEFERWRRLVLRAVFGTMGGGVAALTVGASVFVFGFGPLLCLVFVLAATLGVSLTLATAALTGTAIDVVLRLHWRRLARRLYGLDAGAAEGALEDARVRLQALDAARLAGGRRASGNLLAPWWPRPGDADEDDAAAHDADDAAEHDAAERDAAPGGRRSTPGADVP